MLKLLMGVAIGYIISDMISAKFPQVRQYKMNARPGPLGVAQQPVKAPLPQPQSLDWKQMLEPLTEKVKKYIN